MGPHGIFRRHRMSKLFDLVTYKFSSFTLVWFWSENRNTCIMRQFLEVDMMVTAFLILKRSRRSLRESCLLKHPSISVSLKRCMQLKITLAKWFRKVVKKITINLKYPSTLSSFHYTILKRSSELRPRLIIEEFTLILGIILSMSFAGPEAFILSI